MAVRGAIPTGQPFAVAAAGGRAYAAVSSASDDAITVIDTRSGRTVAAYPMDGTVTTLVVGPAGKRLFAGRTGQHGCDVAVVDLVAQRIASIGISTAPDATIDALRVDAAGRRLFVATSDSSSSRVIVIDVESGHVRRSIELGAPIRGLELGFDSTAYALTSDIDSRGVLNVLDLVGGRVYATVSVGSAPTQLALSPDGARAYVVDYDTVHVVCTETRSVLGRIDGAARPSCVATRAERLYVADYAGTVSSYAVPAREPMLYSQFVAANAVAAPQVRELQGV
jgi:DNA-binding beta-propeller fold protein YncE